MCIQYSCVQHGYYLFLLQSRRNSRFVKWFSVSCVKWYTNTCLKIQGGGQGEVACARDVSLQLWYADFKLTEILITKLPIRQVNPPLERLHAVLTRRDNYRICRHRLMSLRYNCHTNEWDWLQYSAYYLRHFVEVKITAVWVMFLFCLGTLIQNRAYAGLTLTASNRLWQLLNLTKARLGSIENTWH